MEIVFVLFVCLFVCVYVCMYVYVCVCVCVCVCTCLLAFSLSKINKTQEFYHQERKKFLETA